MYQPYFFASFESEDSLEMVPLGRQTIQLEIPIFERTPPGGIGLQDLQGLLRAENRLEGELIPEASVVARMAAETASKSDAVEEKPTTRTIDVWIERSRTWMLLVLCQHISPLCRSENAPDSSTLLQTFRVQKGRCLEGFCRMGWLLQTASAASTSI